MIDIAIVVLIVVIAVLIIHANSIILHDIFTFLIILTTMLPWHHGLVIINTAHLHSTESELRFCEVQILLVVCQRFGMVRTLTMVLAGNKTKCLISVNHTTKTIHQYVL